MGAIGAGLGAVGGIVGGIAGREASRGDAGEARNQAIIAQQILNEIAESPVTSRPLILEKYKQAGVLTPQLESLIEAGPSEVAKITEDPALKDAQMQALTSLSQRAKGGLSPEDRAALAASREQVQGDVESKRQQIMQQMAMRGQSGSGADLAAQLLASQQGAQRQSEEGRELAALASRRALEATSALGGLGGQIRGQDFDINRARSAAADELSRFNVQSAQANQMRNIAAQNAAQEFNLQNLQNIGNINVAQSNQELQRQRQAEADDWTRNLQRAQVRSGGSANLANTLGQSANQQAQSAYNLFGGIGQGLAGVGQAQQQQSNYDKWLKTQGGK